MSLNIKEPKFKVLNNCTPNNTCFITYKQSVLWVRSLIHSTNIN